MPPREFKPTYFAIEDRDSVLIATVTGASLSEEDNIEQFGVELNQIIEIYSTNWLALNLRSVTLMTSSAIGKLIAMHRNLHRREGRLHLCGLSPTVESVLKTAKLIDYFHISPSVDEAVAVLTQERLRPSGDSITKTG